MTTVGATIISHYHRDKNQNTSEMDQMVKFELLREQYSLALIRLVRYVWFGQSCWQLHEECDSVRLLVAERRRQQLLEQ